VNSYPLSPLVPLPYGEPLPTSGVKGPPVQLGPAAGRRRARTRAAPERPAGPPSGPLAVQLRTASRYGLGVPDTLMTSDATASRGFIARHGFGRKVYKIFAATQNLWRER
jgi:hypothetical protein